jgi:type IV secretion system protein VirD4
MRAQQTPSQDGVGDTLLAVALAIAVTAAVGHWLAANLAALIAARHPLSAGLADAFGALMRLPHHAADPRQAWEPRARAELPGPVVYWASVAIVVGGLVAVGMLILSWRQRRRPEPPDKRRRLGVETQARLATTKDLRPLLTRHPEPGRFVLARWGRRYLSTEAAIAGRRRGVQGAVAAFGPSQSGKTTGLIDGVRSWGGPAVVSSVKTDLLRTTLAARAAMGDVKVFDPLGTSGMESASWSPLRRARTLKGALVVAQLLARIGADEAPSDRFWRGQAEQLIAAMLWTAANTEGHTMRHVVRWVLELDRPVEDNTGTLAPLVRLLTDHPESAVALAAKQVQGWLHGQWSTDPRTTSSVYATARNAVWPWADPDIAASAEESDVTLDWLLGGKNTLFLCAPLGDETRVGVVFAVLLHDLIMQAFDRFNRTGEPLDPRLLVLLDEAANTPLPKLPQWTSTVTGAGIQLVTVWQSKAQLDELYGHHADTVLTNHRTKLVYASGLSDLATVQYLSELIGTEHIPSELGEVGATAARNGQRGLPSTAVPFVPLSVLRRLGVGDAVLLHGSSPPAWVHARPSDRPFEA